MNNTIDVRAIKDSLDLRDLLGQHTELHNETAGGREQSGPCPVCGGEDRLHVRREWFFCRECHLKRGDAIDCVQWLGLAADFVAACRYLGGPALLPAEPKRKPTPKRKAADWQDEAWQRDARAMLDKAQEALYGPEGAAGRVYLAERGLTPATWEAWGLGYTEAWDGKLRAARPAIVLPWQRERITALKHRFLTVPDGGLRYTSKGGGQTLAFGLGLTGAHFATLWLVEGELNALSLWQALRDDNRVNFDVVSFGSESGALNQTIRSLAARYQQVIVWTDNPERAIAAQQAIPGAFGMQSPKPDGTHKLDANDLLRAGVLADFARRMQNRFDADPAYVARLREAVAF